MSLVEERRPGYEMTGPVPGVFYAPNTGVSVALFYMPEDGPVVRRAALLMKYRIESLLKSTERVYLEFDARYRGRLDAKLAYWTREPYDLVTSAFTFSLVTVEEELDKYDLVYVFALPQPSNNPEDARDMGASYQHEASRAKRIANLSKYGSTYIWAKDEDPATLWENAKYYTQYVAKAAAQKVVSAASWVKDKVWDGWQSLGEMTGLLDDRKSKFPNRNFENQNLDSVDVPKSAVNQLIEAANFPSGYFTNENTVKTLNDRLMKSQKPGSKKGVDAFYSQIPFQLHAYVKKSNNSVRDEDVNWDSITETARDSLSGNVRTMLQSLVTFYALKQGKFKTAKERFLQSEQFLWLSMIGTAALFMGLFWFGGMFFSLSGASMFGAASYLSSFYGRFTEVINTQAKKNTKTATAVKLGKALYQFNEVFRNGSVPFDPNL